MLENFAETKNSSVHTTKPAPILNFLLPIFSSPAISAHVRIIDSIYSLLFNLRSSAAHKGEWLLFVFIDEENLPCCLRSVPAFRLRLRPGSSQLGDLRRIPVHLLRLRRHPGCSHLDRECLQPVGERGPHI